jgi:antitoxin PrlF
MQYMIDVTKMSSKGQVTIPVEVRKALKLSEGSKVAFVTDENGRFYIVNSSLIALKNVQNAFEGEAEKAGIENEEDVVRFLKSSENK